jgi:hypothetical protein
MPTLLISRLARVPCLPRGVADSVRLMLDDLARHASAVSGVTSPISSRGMPDALSAAILCPRSRASLAAWAPAEVA